MATSPQAMAWAFALPSANSTSRRRRSGGMGPITPFTRARPAVPSDSIAVLAVPGLTPPEARRASSRRTAPGRTRASMAARQSDGTTSNPPPGRRTTPAARRLVVAGEHRLEHVDLAGDVEVVRRGGETGIDHGLRGRRERSRAVGDHVDALERRRATPRGLASRRCDVRARTSRRGPADGARRARRSPGARRARWPAPPPAVPCTRTRRRPSSSCAHLGARNDRLTLPGVGFPGWRRHRRREPRGAPEARPIGAWIGTEISTSMTAGWRRRGVRQGEGRHAHRHAGPPGLRARHRAARRGAERRDSVHRLLGDRRRLAPGEEPPSGGRDQRHADDDDQQVHRWAHWRARRDRR